MAIIQDDETLQMYIQESREHLETIESDLLEIEAQGEDIDEELVNKVFRAAHSIKGGSGFLGLDKLKKLAHKIENILDLIRNKQLAPSSQIISKILNAFDFLGDLLNNALESNDMDIGEHIAALDAITSKELTAYESTPLSTIITVSHPWRPIQFSVTEFDLQQGLKGGMSFYILSYELLALHRQGKMPIDVLTNMADTGRIIDVITSINEVGTLESDNLNRSLPMHVLFASIMEEDLMGTVMELEKEAIVQLDSNILYAPSTQSLSSSPKPPSTSPESSLAKSPVQTPKKETPGKPKKNRKDVSSQQESIRVQVEVLDQLMNRAGELVLARNQLLQTLSATADKDIIASGQRIDLVTSELQEIIMLTRMQPVANIFSKFPRVVRDMANQLEKQMSLELEGKEVELDKTLIEGLADPLTHLVRNSADHGIEPPDTREAAGKSRNGRIILRAYHESGQVIVEIEDDGKGLDPEMLAEKAMSKELISKEQALSMSIKEKVNLIMLPGFSTAETITDVSGRGVGMDVVKTNLDKMGGVVEINSELGKGTIIRIKLPLTLAIIPSLLVTSCHERFAVPQVNVRELLHISPEEIRGSIERIGGSEVLVLRGELIPLLHLNKVLSLYPMFTDLKTGEKRPDRRSGLVDKRSETNETSDERRYRYDSDINIIVVQAGSFKYGLVVDQLHDTVEIVVKPLGRHLKHFEFFAGATIMGDGHVALILDVAGLAKTAQLEALTDTEQHRATNIKNSVITGKTQQSLLLFHNGPDEQCGIPLQLVLRVEEINQKDIEIKGGKKVIQYRGGSLPIYALEEVANVEMMEAAEQLNVIIFNMYDREIGLLAAKPLDILDADMEIDEQTLAQPGIAGSALIKGKTTLLVDINGLLSNLNPNWTAEPKKQLQTTEATPTILLAEDSKFFMAQVKQFVEEAGYIVLTAEDGLIAWQLLQDRIDEISLVLTDIEMPEMDGFELTRKIKADSNLRHLPVIALTSLAGEEDFARGEEVGIDEYMVKLDKEKLLAGLVRFLPNQT